MANNEHLTSSPPSNRSILIGLGGGIVLGSIILVTTILPAEFGVDPLGVGNLLGLTELSRAENPFEEQLLNHRSDYVEFELGPFESVEYKYTMDLDAPMVFTWSSDEELYYDMHAEPAGLEIGRAHV